MARARGHDGDGMGQWVQSLGEQIGTQLRARPQRVGWPHTFVPTSVALEQQFYPGTQAVIDAARACMADGT